MKFSPITALFGHRQVGKTTLASGLASRYVTLDLASSASAAENAPELFLEQNANSPLVIDECQLVPQLFPALKEWVRQNPRPGQFILTGSVRFSSRKTIRESLTGRFVAWELLPMDCSEIYQSPLPKTLKKILDSNDLRLPLTFSSYYSQKAYDLYLTQGGLPGLFSIRDLAVRRQRFETQLNTMIERDLKLIVQTTLSFRVLRQLLTLLAKNYGKPIEWTDLSRETRISVPTIRKLVAALEAMFLIRILPTEGSQKKPVLFFEDVGEANYLANIYENAMSGMLAFLFSNLRPQVVYRPEDQIEMFQFRQRGGALVPLCFRSRSQHLGLIPLLEESPTESSIRSAQSFLKTYSKSKVLLVHNGKRDQILSDRIRMISAGQLV